MSVDDRLREAFGQTDRTWDDRAATALRAVTARERRERVTRRTAITMAAAAATAAVVLVVTNPGDRDQSPAPQPPTPTSTSEPTNPVGGHWVSAPVTRADVRRAARLAGDPSDAATMLEGLPELPFRVTLFVDDSRNEMFTRFRHGGQEVLTDQENIEVAGGQLVLTPQLADGANVHTWAIRDGELRLAFVSTSEATENGVPAEAWQRLIYDAEPFTRQG